MHRRVMDGVDFLFFFFNDTATTEIYTLSLHDALPIFGFLAVHGFAELHVGAEPAVSLDRKSTRLNSSHTDISYAVFCLKKKKTHTQNNNSDSTHDVDSCRDDHTLHV